MILLISFLILFVSISFLVNIGKEMSPPGFRRNVSRVYPLIHESILRYQSSTYDLLYFG